MGRAPRAFLARIARKQSEVSEACSEAPCFAPEQEPSVHFARNDRFRPSIGPPWRRAPNTRYCGSGAAGAIPFPGANSTLSNGCGTISGPTDRLLGHPRGTPRLKAAFVSRRAPPNFQNASCARPGRVRELKKGPKLLPFPSIFGSESCAIKGFSDFRDKFFSRP